MGKNRVSELSPLCVEKEEMGGGRKRESSIPWFVVAFVPFIITTMLALTSADSQKTASLFSMIFGLPALLILCLLILWFKVKGVIHMTSKNIVMYVMVHVSLVVLSLVTMNITTGEPLAIADRLLYLAHLTLEGLLPLIGFVFIPNSWSYPNHKTYCSCILGLKVLGGVAFVCFPCLYVLDSVNFFSSLLILVWLLGFYPGGKYQAIPLKVDTDSMRMHEKRALWMWWYSIFLRNFVMVVLLIILYLVYWVGGLFWRDETGSPYFVGWVSALFFWETDMHPVLIALFALLSCLCRAEFYDNSNKDVELQRPGKVFRKSSTNPQSLPFSSQLRSLFTFRKVDQDSCKDVPNANKMFLFLRSIFFFYNFCCLLSIFQGYIIDNIQSGLQNIEMAFLTSDGLESTGEGYPFGVISHSFAPFVDHLDEINTPFEIAYWVAKFPAKWFLFLIVYELLLGYRGLFTALNYYHLGGLGLMVLQDPWHTICIPRIMAVFFCLHVCGWLGLFASMSDWFPLYLVPIITGFFVCLLVLLVAFSHGFLRHSKINPTEFLRFHWIMINSCLFLLLAHSFLGLTGFPYLWLVSLGCFITTLFHHYQSKISYPCTLSNPKILRIPPGEGDASSAPLVNRYTLLILSITMRYQRGFEELFQGGQHVWLEFVRESTRFFPRSWARVFTIANVKREGENKLNLEFHITPNEEPTIGLVTQPTFYKYSVSRGMWGSFSRVLFNEGSIVMCGAGAGCASLYGLLLNKQLLFNKKRGVVAILSHSNPDYQEHLREGLSSIRNSQIITLERGETWKEKRPEWKKKFVIIISEKGSRTEWGDILDSRMRFEEFDQLLSSGGCSETASHWAKKYPFVEFVTEEFAMFFILNIYL